MLQTTAGLNKNNIFSIQALIAALIFIARYIFYIYLIRSCREAAQSINQVCRSLRAQLSQLWAQYTAHCCLLAAATSVLVYHDQPLFTEDFLPFLVADLITKYLDMEKQCKKISYGTGMACNFFEGYLTHVLPSDGHRFVGFAENIRVFESKESVRFPVKRLFIIVTKSLYCPPDLKEFNNSTSGLPYLEACTSLEDVIKDVAGVKNRIYRNSAYKIVRPQGAPVYVAAECATPLHTLHAVLNKRALYSELEDLCETEVVDDFTTMLRSVVDKNPSSRGRCEVLYYDDTNPKLNLADVLLDRIREIEPNYEEIIKKAGQDY